MPYDGLCTYKITRELNELCGNKITRIYQPAPEELVIYFSDRDKTMVQLSAQSSFPRVLIGTHRYDNPVTAPPFCMLLRKYLLGAKLLSVKQEQFDRIINLCFENIDDTAVLRRYTLIAEIMGRHSNLILINDDTGKIVDAIKHITQAKSSVREVLPSRDYVLPPNEKLNPLDYHLSDAEALLSFASGKSAANALLAVFMGLSNQLSQSICRKFGISGTESLNELGGAKTEALVKFMGEYLGELCGTTSPQLYRDELGAAVDFTAAPYEIYSELASEAYGSVSACAEAFYAGRAVKNNIVNRYDDTIKKVSTLLAREQHKLEKRRRELDDAENAEHYNIAGTLLLGNLSRIKKGMKEIIVDNYYEEGMPKLAIALAPHLNPSQNAQWYFKKYTKAKSAVVHLASLIEESVNEVYFLSSKLYYLESAPNAREAEEVLTELADHGAIRLKKKPKPSAEHAQPLSYTSKAGFEILVGRNDRQNDRLTLRTAARDDIWLHTKDIAGSHVILRLNGAEPDDETLLAASSLCAYYSKAREAQKVAVDCTRAKYVKKPSGAAAGRVIYTNQKTLFVAPQSPKELGLKENN